MFVSVPSLPPSLHSHLAPPVALTHIHPGPHMEQNGDTRRSTVDRRPLGESTAVDLFLLPTHTHSPSMSRSSALLFYTTLTTLMAVVQCRTDDANVV